MPYDYKTAIAALNDNDKNRILAIYFNSDAITNNSSVNWQKAADDFGCASIDSMKVMLRYALKKIEKAAAAGGAGGTAVPPTPAKATPAKRARKRKAADAAAAEEGEDDAEETPKAPKGKKGRKAKAKTSTPDADGDEEGGEAVVKGEKDDSD